MWLKTGILAILGFFEVFSKYIMCPMWLLISFMNLLGISHKNEFTSPFFEGFEKILLCRLVLAILAILANFELGVLSLSNTDKPKRPIFINHSPPGAIWPTFTLITWFSWNMGCPTGPGVKSCRGGPQFLPTPNLPLHPISSTSREAMPRIRDPRGPHQSPKMTKNTP